MQLRNYSPVLVAYLSGVIHFVGFTWLHLFASCLLRGLALQVSPGSSMELVSERTRQPVQPNVVEFDRRTRQFIVRDYWHWVDATDNYMWSLPAHFLQNKVLHCTM